MTAATAAHAREARSARYSLFRAMRETKSHDAGLLMLADALEYGVPAHLATVTMPEAYRWVHQHHRRGLLRLLELADISEFLTLGALTYRQRVALVNALRRDEG